MKKIHFIPALLRILLVAAFWFFQTTAFSQKANSGIEGFQAYKSGSKVFIRFSISAGSTCDGIIIRRSIEADNFLPIREIEGICGSDSASITYTEEDELPVFNRQLKYILELGRSGFSDTLNSFFTETSAAGYILTRQAEGWKILVENASNELIKLFVYDVHGKHVLLKETRSDFFEIPSAKLPASPIFFRLYHTKSGLIDSGKLIF
jgi:hypothetical protein